MKAIIPIMQTKIQPKIIGKLIPLPQLEKNKNNAVSQIAIAMKSKTWLIQSKDILYLKADGNYTSIFLRDGSHHLGSNHLKSFENKLGTSFMRVHQSYLIQTTCIKFYQPADNIIELINGQQIPVSRSNKSVISNYLKQWTL